MRVLTQPYLFIKGRVYALIFNYFALILLHPPVPGAWSEAPAGRRGVAMCVVHFCEGSDLEPSYKGGGFTFGAEAITKKFSQREVGGNDDTFRTDTTDSTALGFHGTRVDIDPGFHI